MRNLLALLLALVFIPATARAAWIPNGNPICVGTGAQSQVSLCPDGSGRFYATWNDARSGNSAVYVTHVLGDGTIPASWPANGLQLSLPNAVGRPFVVPDGEGGAVVVWEAGTTICLQGVGPDGLVYYAAGGITVIPFPTVISSPFNSTFAVVSDGAGGAYVAWQRRVDDATATASVTRIHADGTFFLPFNASGVPFHTIANGGPNIYQYLQLSLDASGGVAVALDWVYDGPFVHYYSLVGHVAANAIVNFTQTLYGGDTLVDGIVSDGQGGFLAAWYADDRYVPSYSRLQKYGAAGQKQWPDTTRFYGNDATIVSDGGGGMYVVEIATFNRIQARRLLADGSLAPGWPANGVPIALNQNASAPTRVVPTSNGFLAVWQDGNPDLHAAAWMSNAALAPGWPPGGTNVCVAAGDQKNAVVLPSSTSGAFVAWEDSRNGNVDLYATRVEAAPPVSVPPAVSGALAFRAVAPNPARDYVRVDLALGSGELATLDVIDVSGRVRAHTNTSATSNVSLSGLAPGLYWLRATRDGSSVTARLAIVR